MNWNYIDWIVIGIYFLGMLCVGYYFSKRVKTTEDYFSAGHRVPAWVTACSIYATMLSSISFLAIPASIYAGGILRGMGPIGIMLIIIWVGNIFVPFFRRIQVETAYEYLEKRFDRSFRLISSGAFILFHIIRIAIVLYLPILAIQQALPNVNPIILTAIIGILCVSYTSIGGIEAVLWSDTIQTIVLLVGALLICYFGFSAIPEGQSAWTILKEGDKLISGAEWGFSLTGTTLIGMIIGGFVNSIYAYIGSQDVVQRYNVTPNEEAAKRSLFLNIPLLIVSMTIFIGMGAALYVFYNIKGGTPLPSSVHGNAILPYFIVSYMPIGIGGLIIAAIFAASQSTVSSSLNSLSTCITLDFVGSFNKNLKDKTKLTIARSVSWGIGLISSLLAIQFLIRGQGDIFLYFQVIIGLFGGPVAGLFLLGIFFNNVGTKAAWIGFISSISVAIYISDPAKLLSSNIPNYVKPEIFEYLVSLVIIASCLIPAFIASFIFSKPDPKQLKGLTYLSVIKKINT